LEFKDTYKGFKFLDDARHAISEFKRSISKTRNQIESLIYSEDLNKLNPIEIVLDKGGSDLYNARLHTSCDSLQELHKKAKKLFSKINAVNAKNLVPKSITSDIDYLHSFILNFPKSVGTQNIEQLYKQLNEVYFHTLEIFTTVTEAFMENKEKLKNSVEITLNQALETI
jgi:hypothetical protein